MPQSIVALSGTVRADEQRTASAAHEHQVRKYLPQRNETSARIPGPVRTCSKHRRLLRTFVVILQGPGFAEQAASRY